MLDTDALIIGAGPYGVATAHALHARGLRPFVVGEPFALWHRHTLDGMRLRSDPRMSSIGPFDFQDWLRRRGLPWGAHERIRVEHFRDYLHEVVDGLPFPLHSGRVDHLARVAEGDESAPPGARFVATTDDGTTVAARSVVIATGSGTHTHVPSSLRHLPPDRLLHSWDVERIQVLDDARVLVVGAGQSAAETVETLAPGNRVTWVLRHPVLFFREPLRAPTPIFKLLLAVSPALYKVPRTLRRALQSAFFRTTVTPDLRAVYQRGDVVKLFADADDLALRLDGDGRGDRGAIHCGLDERHYDAVVAATGFRYSLAGLPFLDSALARELGALDAVPPLDDDFQTPVAGVYLAGGIAEGAFGPAQRFLLGSRYASQRIAGAIAAG